MFQSSPHLGGLLGPRYQRAGFGRQLFDAMMRRERLSAQETTEQLEVFFPECVARVPVSLWGCGG